MPKAYWIAHVSIKDPEQYKKYVAANAVAFKKFNARFIVRAGQHEIREGKLLSADQRHVVIEFPDMATARACYDSPEYKVAVKEREGAADANLMIIEGYEG